MVVLLVGIREIKYGVSIFILLKLLMLFGLIEFW